MRSEATKASLLTKPIALTLVVLASITIGLLACEGITRLILNAGDYLTVTVVPDEILGIRVSPESPGFDSWGFRNRRVPPEADIVAIGDSHTYGHNASMSDSWPYVTARLTGRSVYNLALGGYGPNQYYYLLNTYALKLKPRWVFCGLYMGDDFENAFLITYGKDYWSSLRHGQWGSVDPDIWKQSKDARLFRAPRQWLSRHSVVYQLVVHGPILGGVKGFMQITRAAHGPETTSLVVPDANIREGFRPIWIRDRLNQRSLAVREGMRLTFQLLHSMDLICRQHGCQFVVVVIPTKEMVFAKYLLRDPALHLRGVVADLVANEEEARARLFSFLADRDIRFIDTLPALRLKTGEQLYTRSDRDMHPARNGYRVIGEAVAQFLR